MTMHEQPTPLFESPAAFRQAVRKKEWQSHTVGVCPGHVQGNVIILPKALAADFLTYAMRNPKPCPILHVGTPGQFDAPMLGKEIDIRSDLPLYRVWRRGEVVAETKDITEFWSQDLVTFIVGCSFSFEEALLEAGIPLRHVSEKKNVSMYRTAIPTVESGPFKGNLVVSMRPLTPSDAIRSILITNRYPSVHGAPVHIGDPKQLGIRDIQQPEFGDPIEIKDGEIPVFWACGVTTQVAAMAAKPDLCITHAPGSMLVTDQRNQQYAVG
jgi:uncharacterized protein YcsI (UPF0317 family)